MKLGLVKPKEQPSRGNEFQPSADRGTLQYQLTEEEIEQKYQYDEFLEQVIEGKEKNLTIVGEPGAGKSTWLEQIALYVGNSNKGFPICISLASLGGKTLEEYLFQIWLKNALLISQCDVGITSAQKKLEELFKSGKVWLLLDGVDEMRADESPLQAIATQLEGWGDLARVVLTCRSNVWEANPNTLLNFETYSTLHFDDEQVGDFIQQWFTQEGKPELGEELETKLDDTSNDCIRDLIKNPLRLAMLCGIWYSRRGDLPKTKATLYQQYIEEYFYRWKQHPQLADDLDKQEELHAAFSKLAVEAIDKKLPLRKKFVHKKMGKSLFQLARDVGWLNWVYKDAETGEDVYAFFHLTFQEYFATCAIGDWHFFLNHVPDNPMQGTYRIFEPQWQDVILLWLGLENVAKEQKEELINALVEFEDRCQHFYGYRAYFLAAHGIDEFVDCSLQEKLRTVMESPLDEIHDEVAMQKLRIPINVFLLNTPKILDRLRYFINLLKQLGFDNLKVKDIERQDALIQLLSSNQNELNPAITSIDSSDNLKNLIEYLATDQNMFTRRAALKRLLEIVSSNPNALIEALYANWDEGVYQLLAWLLEKVDPKDLDIVNVLIHLLQNSQNELLRVASAQSLTKIVQGSLCQVVVEHLKQGLTDEFRKNEPELYLQSCQVLWHCAHNLPYPDFYQAWHQTIIHERG